MQVTGRTPEAMTMVVAPSEAELRALPLDKWGIPVPHAAWLDEHGDHATSGEVDCIIVPCVALDHDCRRLGHGGGYYDSFIARTTEKRLATGLPPPVTIGVALADQIIEGEIPVGPLDR